MNHCHGITKAGTPCKRKPIDGTEFCPQHTEGLLESLGGRPTKLTEDVGDRILELLFTGNYRETAAQAAGIHKQTLYDWIARGEEYETPEEAPEKERIFVRFSDAVKRAEAIAESRLLHRASLGGFGWQAQMTVLERKFPNRWGRRERHEHTGADGGPINVTFEELAKVASPAD